MATARQAKVRLSTTTAVAAVVGTASGNASWPVFTTGVASSRPPSTNLETVALKKGALEKIARAINDNCVMVRGGSAPVGRQKVKPSQVSTVLGGIVS
jgi:hypothetical protein